MSKCTANLLSCSGSAVSLVRAGCVIDSGCNIGQKPCQVTSPSAVTAVCQCVCECQATNASIVRTLPLSNLDCCISGSCYAPPDMQYTGYTLTQRARNYACWQLLAHTPSVQALLSRLQSSLTVQQCMLPMPQVSEEHGPQYPIGRVGFIHIAAHPEYPQTLCAHCDNS
jgi:hypothetical protein